jgi:transcriptional regulator with XRE-family HTH domain
VSDESMKDFLRMRLQPEMSQELPPIERRKELRNAFGLKRKELAEQMGVSIATIGAWETGRNEPRGDSRTKYLAFCRAAEEILREREVSIERSETNESTED